jgi:hypothetical protein
MDSDDALADESSAWDASPSHRVFDYTNRFEEFYRDVVLPLEEELR